MPESKPTQFVKAIASADRTTGNMLGRGCIRSLEKYIPADADIVIVEFALNDKNSTKPWCGMETPIRCDPNIARAYRPSV